jgi:uncharacterized protein YjbI with pentapeptide repeats
MEAEKKLIEVKNRFAGKVIFSAECLGVRACLELAVVADANLSGADLSGADLRYADLSGANLRGADLRYASLSGADLSGAATIIYGLNWDVYITKNHIRIGCENHTLEDWESFGDDQINNMEIRALEFWNEYKAFILSQCRKLSGEKK